MATDSHKAEEDQLDKTGEFFTVGGPLNPVKAGYIRRSADELLIDTVSAHRYVHIAAPNRTGKSSLIAGAAAHLENNGVRVAVLDLGQISSRDTESDPGRWYYNVAYRLMRQLRIRFDLQEWWQDKSVLSNRQRLLEFYSEILLPNLNEDIVIFVDSLQCVEELPFADQLLASIRSAFNARGLDPEFMRLTFVMVGEYDPQSLITDDEVSPFSISRRVRLKDFSREEIDTYSSELEFPADLAEAILDRIFYWTNGHPYLTQKLARAICRVDTVEDPVAAVDAVVRQQFAGRAAVKNEPHMSHIHRRIIDGSMNKNALLTLYGKVRKGVSVVTDLADPQQRRLIATGLLVVDPAGKLVVRNRLYESVFTARWANENLSTHWRAPAYAAGFVLLMIFVPFWYTQLLPKAYVDVLTETQTELADAQSTWLAFRSFPGHGKSADSLYRNWLLERAARATDLDDILQISAQARELEAGDSLPERLLADFWQRRATDARRLENRDEALLSTIESLLVSTREKRNRAASLIAEDYPLLLATLAMPADARLYFDPLNQVISSLNGAEVRQWTIKDRAVHESSSWKLSALDVSPIVRRVAVDEGGGVRQIALRIRISHQRIEDLSIRLIAPSGRSVPIKLDQERAIGSQELNVSRQQLRSLLGEEVGGTWSLSIRDQGVGIAGYLVAWSLSLNSQALIEQFERGINIPNPTETTPSSVWVDPRQRFVVARSSSGDSVRLWDLNFAKPVAILPIPESEDLVGFNRDGTVFVTATLDGLNLWDVLRSEQLGSIESELATTSFSILPDANAVIAKRVLETGASYQLLSLDGGKEIASLDIAGQALIDNVSADGRRLAVVDYDRSLRVWDLMSGELLARMDLRHRATDLRLANSGEYVAVVYADRGVVQWRVDSPVEAVFEESGAGRWAFKFSPTGQLSVTGDVGRGYQLRRSQDGSLVGPLTGQFPAQDEQLLAFSDDELTMLTSGANGSVRFWRIPKPVEPEYNLTHMNWSPAFDGPLVLSEDGSVLVTADNSGHVHVRSVQPNGLPLSAEAEEITYLGHASPVRKLAVNTANAVAASVSDDSKLKFWSLENGQPSEWSVDLPTEELLSMRFAPDGQRLGLLYTDHLLLIEESTGAIVNDIRFIDPKTAFTFFGEGQIFVGSSAGVLSLIDLEQPVSTQVVWEGGAALTHLAIAPNASQMIIGDAENRLLQFNLESNELNASRIQLPSRIEQLLFSPIASRVFVRTERWMHGFSTSPTELHWKDAILLPGIPGGANVVAVSGTHFMFPVPNGTDLEVSTIEFANSDSAGLFGNREDLLREWSSRLGRETVYQQSAVIDGLNDIVSDDLRAEF